MPATYLISDTHFGHVGCTRFCNNDGSKMRPWDDVEEMDEAMIENWNSVVGPKDLVYHLGDVVINRKYLNLILPRLNGRKKLVRGNHDIFRLKDYLPHFEDVLGVKVMDDCIMSHIPLHPANITKRFGVNVHGHMHGNVVTKQVPAPPPDDPEDWGSVYGDFISVPDPRYISVCVEQINYTPIDYEQIRKMINDRR